MSGVAQNKFIAANYPVLLESYKLQREKQQNLFEEYFDNHIDAFTKVMLITNRNIPKHEAEKLGTYLLRGLFNINTEFIDMIGADFGRESKFPLDSPFHFCG